MTYLNNNNRNNKNSIYGSTLLSLLYCMSTKMSEIEVISVESEYSSMSDLEEKPVMPKKGLSTVFLYGFSTYISSVIVVFKRSMSELSLRF